MPQGTTLYRLTTSVAAPDWHFDPGTVLALKAGDRLPATLLACCEQLPADVGVPVDVVRFDPGLFVRETKLRVEPDPPKPLTEDEVRRKFRLRDPDLWAAARGLNFPAATLKKTRRMPPNDRLVDEPLWQEPEILTWLERVQALAPVVLGLAKG